MTTAPYEIRTGTDADLPFVYGSWLESYKESKLARAVRTSIYLTRHHDLVERLLDRPSVRLRVAHPPGDPVVILGWAVVEEPLTLHYVLVKHQFRGHGVAKALVGFEPAVCSHKCADVERWFRAHPEVAYDPYTSFMEAPGAPARTLAARLAAREEPKVGLCRRCGFDSCMHPRAS